MSGGGMGFLFSPERKPEAQERLQAIMSETKRAMEHSVPFAMEPVVYDFAINERGTQAAVLSGDAALMPAGYYTLAVPPLLRTEARDLSPDAARNSSVSPRPAAPSKISPAWCTTSSITCCRAGRMGKAAGQTAWRRCSKLRVRPRAARADPGRPAFRPHWPGAEPPAGHQPHRRRRTR